MSVVRPTCLDTEGECFARTKYGNCTVLNACSENCRFKKPTATKTNGSGRDYPFNPLYVGMNDSGGREMTGAAWKARKEI